jgi:hypothetical protein
MSGAVHGGFRKSESTSDMHSEDGPAGAAHLLADVKLPSVNREEFVSRPKHYAAGDVNFTSR